MALLSKKDIDNLTDDEVVKILDKIFLMSPSKLFKTLTIKRFGRRRLNRILTICNSPGKPDQVERLTVLKGFLAMFLERRLEISGAPYYRKAIVSLSDNELIERMQTWSVYFPDQFFLTILKTLGKSYQKRILEIADKMKNSSESETKVIGGFLSIYFEEKFKRIWYIF